jgi:hypothetical protein
VVPWPVISPTFPRKPSKLLTQAARPSHFSPTPPSPTLSWIFTSPQPPSSSSSHFICHFFTFSLHSVISSFDPCHRLSHLHFIHYLSRLLCFQYITLSISSFPRSWTPDCAIVLQTACESIRAYQRPRRPTDQNFVATPLKTSFYVLRKLFPPHKINPNLLRSSSLSRRILSPP